MKAEWTGDAVAIMHMYDISAASLAEKLGWNPKYLSAVLNCKRSPKKAETSVMTSLAEMVREKSSNCS